MTGLAPCLSHSISCLLQHYLSLPNPLTITLYLSGYHGLLMRQSIVLNDRTMIKEYSDAIFGLGGSVIGNSRVKLTNVEDCVKRGFVQVGEDPLTRACEILSEDGIDVLHTIGGDDTSTQAAEIARRLKVKGYDLTVVGLPKTIDCDVHPVKLTLGATSAAIHTGNYFSHVVNESTASVRTLIVHEVMGRDCGYLTAKSAYFYRRQLRNAFKPVPFAKHNIEAYDIHGVYIPEVPVDFKTESIRLRNVMDSKFSHPPPHP